MANTIIVANLLQKEVIKNLDKKAVIFPCANPAYTGELKEKGTTVEVETLPSFNMDMGQTAGNDITAQDWAITSETLVINEVFNKNLKIKDLEAIQSNLNLRSQLWGRIAEATARTYDQYVASLIVENTYSWNRLVQGSPATETTSTITTTLDAIAQTLEEQNVDVAWGDVYCFINPACKGLINSSDLYKSFDKWLAHRQKGYIGDYAWMMIISTNNLPFKQKITLTTIPTANDTFTMTIKWTAIVWTFVASGGASSAWDISIWANAAAAQANMVLAINWTWTPAAATYIDVSAANRKLIANALCNLTTFASDVTYFTAAYYVLLAEAVTPADFVIWTASKVLMAVEKNAVNFVSQQDWYKITDAEKWFYSNLLAENAFGWKVFAINARKMVTKEVTNWATVVDINSQ